MARSRAAGGANDTANCTAHPRCVKGFSTSRETPKILRVRGNTEEGRVRSNAGPTSERPGTATLLDILARRSLRSALPLAAEANSTSAAMAMPFTDTQNVDGVVREVRNAISRGHDDR